jgi:hypothetical protein
MWDFDAWLDCEQHVARLVGIHFYYPPPTSLIVILIAVYYKAHF